MNKIWEPLTGNAGIYRTEQYPINEDSLRLVSFLRVQLKDRVLDFGTGNGILAILSEAEHGGMYTGIDLDSDALALAKESSERNGQTIAFYAVAVSDAPSFFGHGSFDRIIANPPYFTSGPSGARALARHADETLLSDWCHAAFLLLNNGGTFSLCYPADQLTVLLRSLDQNRLMPKRMELVLTGAKARLALVEAKKLGKDGLALTVSRT